MTPYKLIYYQTFLADFSAILDYIEQDDPASASHVYNKVFASIEALRDFPRLGFKGKVENTYEIIPSGLSFTIVYQLNETREQVIITNIFRHAQKRA